MDDETETVSVEQPVIQENVVEEPVVEAPEEPQEDADQSEKQVPLSALQKERKKRQELELKTKWLEEQQSKKAAPEPEPDNSRYETATREDLSHAESKIIRAVEEKTWIKHNEDKYIKIQDELEDFLKQRPHLRSAIADAPNRYEEAWTLMTALNPKKHQAERPANVAAAKKHSPRSPQSVPKSTAMAEAVDVMSMSDSEFLAWRQSKRKTR